MTDLRILKGGAGNEAAMVGQMKETHGRQRKVSTVSKYPRTGKYVYKQGQSLVTSNNMNLISLIPFNKNLTPSKNNLTSENW